MLVENPKDACSLCDSAKADAALTESSGVPLCAPCHGAALNRELPPWVKNFFIGLVVFVAASLVWNARFLRSYLQVRSAQAAMEAHDLDAAVASWTKAAELVPESPSLAGAAAFYDGLRLMREDKSALALGRFEIARSNSPEPKQFDGLILHAKIGAAFDATDYDAFLALARKALAEDPADAVALGQTASALACKYAVTGDRAFEREALELLVKARAAAKPEDAAGPAEYEQRIRYRLETRQIITKAEFDRRFPKGWTAGAR